MKYSITVYEDHVIVTGWLTSDVLKLLIKLCNEEGFKYLTNNPDGNGFKLVR